MPGTGDGPVLEMTAAQRGAHVRADVVDGAVIPAAVEKNRDQLFVDLDGLALALFDVADFAHRWNLTHVHPHRRPQSPPVLVAAIIT